MSIRPLGVLIAALALPVASSPDMARAQATAATAQETDACLSNARCRGLTDGAYELSKAGQLRPALTAYMEARRVAPVLWLYVNIGRVQFRMGRHADAIVSYRAYLDGPRAEQEAELVTKAREYLAQAESEQKLHPQPVPPAWERAPRPVWRYVLGGFLAASGVAMMAGGGYTLPYHGRCVEPAVSPAAECMMIYSTASMGIPLVAIGGAVFVSGIVTIALPGPRRRTQAGSGDSP